MQKTTYRNGQNKGIFTGQWYVVRTYSGTTAKKVLWKVESRPIADKSNAEVWLKTLETEHPSQHYFIIYVPPTLDNGETANVVLEEDCADCATSIPVIKGIFWAGTSMRCPECHNKRLLA